MDADRNDLSFLSIAEVEKLLVAGRTSSGELVTSHLERIALLDPILGAYITVTGQAAIEAAAAADGESRRGARRGALHGVPIAHKDNVATANLRTTAGTRALATNVPEDDAAIVRSLRVAGTVLLGKTNLHELACGAMEGYGVTRNAWDLARAAGGSSSGSASAVAAGLAVAATGSETGGSVRVPAAFSGLVGFKPTDGTVDPAGILPISATLDTPAWLTRTALDALLLLDAMQGGPGAPPTAGPTALEGTTVGLATSTIATGVADGGVVPAVGNAIREAATVLSELGASVVEVELPDRDLIAASHHATWLFEAVRCLGRFLFEETGTVGSVVRNRLRPGALLTEDDYALACRVREHVGRDLAETFDGVDVVLCPATPFPAYRLDDFVTARSDVSRFNRLTNLTGNPAMALPSGFDAAGLPLGMQLIGRHGEDRRLLQVAMAYQEATSWHERRPDAAERYLRAQERGEAPELPTGRWPAGSAGLTPLEPHMLPTLDRLRSRSSDTDLDMSDDELESAARQLHRTLDVLSRFGGAD